MSSKEKDELLAQIKRLQKSKQELCNVFELLSIPSDEMDNTQLLKERMKQFINDAKKAKG